MPEVQSISAFKCRMWEMHDRVGEELSVDSCRTIIDSIHKHGQKRPALGRRIADASHHIELIYGARRLFAARHLGIDLLVEVREIDDRSALIEMDIENRVRTDISPYERGISYRTWLRQGYFSNQVEIARCLGVSEAQISRLLKFAELPMAVVAAFASTHAIREEWAVVLARHCKDPASRDRILRRARELRAGGSRRALEVYDALINAASDHRSERVSRRARDEVICDGNGAPVLRVSYRIKTVHFIVARDRLTQPLLSQLAQCVVDTLEHADDARQPDTRRCPRPGAAQPLLNWPRLGGTKRPRG